MTAAPISPTDVTAPSDPVARATARVLHNLMNLSNSRGADTAQIEAMAMYEASLLFLRESAGEDVVAEVIERARIDNDRIATRLGAA